MTDLGQSVDDELVWVAMWADSGPYGGWRRGRQSYMAGLGEGCTALVPRDLWEAYDAALAAKDDAEAALDDAAERYRKEHGR